MAKISGGRELTARLDGMSSPGARQKIGRALFAAAEAIQVEAQLSITRGAISGKGHIPSKPGEPPKADTHTLANNIEAVSVSQDKAEVSSNAPYAAYLEFGTSRMVERPYMRPAVRNTEGERRELWSRLAASLARGPNGA